VRHNSRVKSIYLLITIIYGFSLYFFYLKYVPLIKTFQLVLLPILLAVFILTAINVQWGALFFVFSFPLINGLPYFFGIFEHVPHAPTALVLFLFYFLGWLIHKSRSDIRISARLPVLKPMLIFSLLLLVSLMVTLFRYSNYVPLLSGHSYELITNVIGVTSGGAMMSALFSFLNYLSGFLFFLIIIETTKSKIFAKQIVIALLIGTFISMGFGAYQLFSDIKIGNMPSKALVKTINATFKDPLSLGAYLGVIIAFALGAILAFKGWLKILPFIVLIGGILILPSTGSLSGILGASVSSLLFFFLVFVIAFRSKGSNIAFFRKLTVIVLFLVFVISAAMTVFFAPKSPVSFSKLKRRISVLEKKKDLDVFTSARYTYFWPMALEMVKDYPLSGVGIGAYIIELPNYAQIHGNPRRISDSAENYFLQVGSELGIFALLCSLWLFWAILRQMRRTFRANAEIEGWNYLTAGISAGIFSLFVIYFFHTFIGSYEIKYTFWLLVGLAFCLGRTLETRESGNKVSEIKNRKVSWNKPLKIIGAIVITIFGASLLWNSTHSLSLASRTKLLGLKQDLGFYQLEKTNDGREFRWTREYGGLTIKIEKPVIEIPLLASHPDIQENPIKVKIYIVKDLFKQKKLLDEVTLTQSTWKTYKYSIPQEVGQEVILFLEVNRTWNPLKTFGTPDPRNLGVAVGKIEFEDKPGL
jgi:O-antigen ligase